MDRFITDVRYWSLPVIIWAAVASASLLWSVDMLDRHLIELALNEGRFVSRMIEASRLWNAKHGGVYVLTSPESPPNRYLEDSDRDIVDHLGRTLTKVNAMTMTRELAEAVFERTEVRVRLTSLRPLNPGNAPSPWELAALASFEKGGREHLEIQKRQPAPLARYMAPVMMLQACLRCHEKQGYRPGEVRGGISVSFSTEPFETVIERQRQTLLLNHLAMWLMLSALTLVALHGIRHNTLRLKRERDDRDALVNLRTSQLRAEVRDKQQAASELRLLINASDEAMFGIDRAGGCTFCNPAARSLLRLTDNEALLGRNMPELIAGSDGNLKERLKLFLDGAHVHTDTDSFRRADGSRFPVEFRVSPVTSNSAVTGAVITFSDISERRSAQEQVWRQANYDQLTGLPNRGLLVDRIERAIAAGTRSFHSFALLFIDLDGFKPVNDTLGHNAGDAVLREIAGRLHNCIRDADTVARLGGDEFAILVTGPEDRVGARTVARKVLHSVALPLNTGGRAVLVSASVGIALYPEDGIDADTLLQAADEAMYWSKQAGKNRYCLFSGADGPGQPETLEEPLAAELPARLRSVG